MNTTTLNKIRAHDPCEPGWKKLLRGLSKTEVDGDPLTISEILRINGIRDAIWALRASDATASQMRHFACDCAQLCTPNPDPRVQSAIDVARRFADGDATEEEVDAAWAVAWAAARDDARDDVWPPRAAAWDAAMAAAMAAARDDVWADVWDAAMAAARYDVVPDVWCKIQSAFVARFCGGEV